MSQAQATAMELPNADRNGGSPQAAMPDGVLNDSATRSGSSPSGELAAGNVEKIREILFGAQMRQYDSRLAELEERLSAEVADLRETTRKRLDALETYAKRELESLQQNLNGERDERTNAIRQLARDINELRDSLIQKIGELDLKNIQADRQSRLELLQLSKEVNEEMRTKQEDTRTLIERRFKDLQNAKLDRAALASLFVELATRVNGEFQLPSR